MYHSKNLNRFCIKSSLTVIDALRHLERNKIRTSICCDENGRFIGTFSFGDLNRWLLGTEIPNFEIDILSVINRDAVYLTELCDTESFKKKAKRYKVVPLVNMNMHVIGIITDVKLDSDITIGSFVITENSEPFIIAEIGNNHNGSLLEAKRLIRLAKESGAHSAKFQLRDMTTLYGDADLEQPENLGTEYTLDLLKRFQLQNNELEEAMRYAKSLDLIPLCTPWDQSSVDILEGFGVAGYKVASADLTNHDLLWYIAATGKPMICSTGMSNEDEIKESVSVLKRSGAQFVLLHCNSTYPAPFKDVNLNYIPRLIELSGGFVGYSGHERDINVAIGATALGAKVIEKHFTTDRSLEGNDHKVSLLPDEFKNMVTGINQVHKAMGDGDPRTLTQGELMNRVTLSKSIYAAHDLEEGSALTRSDLVVKSPGKGLQPNYLTDLLSKPLKRDVHAGDVFYPSDLYADAISAKQEYKFWSKWGIPVRYHDYRSLYSQVRCPILEFHLSYKDLELDPNEFFEDQIAADLVVHAPELFYGDHTLDISSPNREYREHSLRELRKTIEVVKKLKPFFQNHNSKIGLITNVGGFSDLGPLEKVDIDERVDNLVKSLLNLNNPDVEILPQTMPPFPWHFGGQQYHNLFVDDDWIRAFCQETGIRVCLDISHSALACTNKNKSFSAFLDKVMPFTAHLHLADAAGVDAEGLQIGDGAVDWGLVSSKMKEHCPNGSWIPEIWQGHENKGEGFWIGLDKLEKEGF